MEPIDQSLLENEMSFIVVYQRADGTSAVESCSTLDAAIRAAERLRNLDAVERPRIFETNEIRYDFQPYYRIQVIDNASGAVVGNAAAQQTPATPGATAVERDIAAQQAAATAAAAGNVDVSNVDVSNVDVPDVDMADIDLSDGAVGAGVVGAGVGAAGQDTSIGMAASSPQIADQASRLSEAPQIAEASPPTADGSGLFDPAGSPDMGSPEIAADDVVSEADSVASDRSMLSEKLGGASGVAAGTAAEAAPKPGLFDKFVNSLEGKSGTANAAGTAATANAEGLVGDRDLGGLNPADAIDDVVDDATPRRGLFGR